MDTIIIQNINEIDKASANFVEILTKKYPQSRCIIFDAPMGAGKTTFIKSLCSQLGAIDEVSSPTFSIINDYLCNDNSHIYHFDLYRINDIDEAMATGVEDYIYGNDYCMIEWPELIEPILPDNTIKTTITIQSDNSRVITIKQI